MATRTEEGLFDRVMAEGVQLPFWCTPLTDAERDSARVSLRRTINGAPVIRIDNVTEYLYAGTDQEDWDIQRDFPCIAPPFRHWWMESRLPTRIVSEKHGTTRLRHDLSRFGVYFSALEYGEAQERFARSELSFEEKADLIARCSETLLAKLSAMKANQELATILHTLTEDEQKLAALLETERLVAAGIDLRSQKTPSWRWVLTATLFIEDATLIRGPCCTWTLFVAETGACVDKTFALMLREGQSSDMRLTHALYPCIFAPLLAVSFMHCQNVEVVAVVPSPKAQRQYRRRAGRPLVAYKTLVIDTAKEVLAGASGSSGGGLRQALHTCRGHFKDYRQRGLFGKYRGLFWWPETVRGNAELGIRIKDYEVRS